MISTKSKILVIFQLIANFNFFHLFCFLPLFLVSLSRGRRAGRQNHLFLTPMPDVNRAVKTEKSRALKFTEGQNFTLLTQPHSGPVCIVKQFLIGEFHPVALRRPLYHLVHRRTTTKQLFQCCFAWIPARCHLGSVLCLKTAAILSSHLLPYVPSGDCSEKGLSSPVTRGIVHCSERLWRWKDKCYKCAYTGEAVPECEINQG